MLRRPNASVIRQIFAPLQLACALPVQSKEQAQSDIVPINVVELERVENVEKPGFFQRFFGGASR